ncbi:hypothetical protein EDB82DRAFT_573225 [Fusarium venenatum]|uniref:uncharacterized protein n=1 Tax=Fusarium venenatum TaxID=56646 RepID=UPI001DF80382|nr:hypothetical protein EDB82DRAFT_573225 [Fusarium venenatum]
MKALKLTSRPALLSQGGSSGNKTTISTEWTEGFRFDVDTFQLDVPPFDIDVDIELPDFFEAILKFQFDRVELDVELEATFTGGMTYRINLLKTRGMHIKIVGYIFMGLIFPSTSYLVEAELTIKSGFHVKLDDGILLKMVPFAEDVSDMVFNVGGSSWGPTASTEIPIFTASVTAVCAFSPTPAATLWLLTVTALKTFITESLVTVLSSGEDAIWPMMTGSVTCSPIEFGDNVKEMVTANGKPITYTGGGDNDNDDDSVFHQKSGGVSNAIIVGVSSD